MQLYGTPTYPPKWLLNLLKNSGSFDLVENKKAKSSYFRMYNGATNEYIKYSEFVTGLRGTFWLIQARWH